MHSIQAQNSYNIVLPFSILFWFKVFNQTFFKTISFRLRKNAAVEITEHRKISFFFFYSLHKKIGSLVSIGTYSTPLE